MNDDIDLELPRHDDDASKRDRGTALVIAGTAETPGAAMLAGLAALRVGAGRLQIATDPSVATALAVAIPEARVLSVDDVGPSLDRADAILVGPGCSEDDDLFELVCSKATGTVIVDAGALPSLHRRGALRMPAIATPNATEMQPFGDDVRDVAARLGCVVARRDASTTIAHPDGRVWIDESGCLGLATSGSGDVAAGIMVGLAARGASPEAAAVWAARLHGRAGERLGGIGFLARELLDVLPSLLPQG
jgi:ADP-dependent NAD(P)H-hydrate dehydratase